MLGFVLLWDKKEQNVEVGGRISAEGRCGMNEVGWALG